MLLQVSCVLYVAGRGGVPRVKGLLAVTVGASLLSALVVWVFAAQVSRGCFWTDHAPLPILLTGLLLVPLLPAWMLGDERP